MDINRLLVNDTIERVLDFAVGLKLGQHNNHAGAFYRDPDDNQIYLLHLIGTGQQSGKCLPVRERWQPPWGWMVPNLKREELRLARGYCDLVFDLQEEIPYGFRFGLDHRFAEGTGRLQLTDGCRGLTCATFVLAILHSINIRLLDLDSWKDRPEEQPAMEEIAQAQGAGIADELPCKRYKPEEVAGACITDSIPVVFDRAVELSKHVVEKMVGYLDRRRGGV
jgi:hypothetical protein